VPSANSNIYRLVSIEPASLFRKSKLMPKDEYILFTSREKDVIREVNTGKVCSQVAGALFLSEKTIRKHFRNINQKTGLKSTNLSCLYASKLE
jgi:DNA-binding NarL/FixJ family response regulator